MPLLQTRVSRFVISHVKKQRPKFSLKPHEGFVSMVPEKQGTEFAVFANSCESLCHIACKKQRPKFSLKPHEGFVSMVPETRIELVWVSPHAPQTCVSTNSTTPADNRIIYTQESHFRQVHFCKIYKLTRFLSISRGRNSTKFCDNLITKQKT